MDIIPKILMVDDREDNLVALAKLLAPLNAELHKAYSGNDALQLMLDNEYALVLIDVQMPEMDGFETVEIMRQDKNLETTPVIFVSAIYRDEIHSVKGIESGAVDFIIKPIVPEILLGKTRIFINLYLDRYRLKSNNEELLLSESALKWELNVNRTLADLANRLISPGLSVKDMADLVYRTSLDLTCSEYGFVSEIEKGSGNIVGHAISSDIRNGCCLGGVDERMVSPSNPNDTFSGLWGRLLNMKEAFILNNYDLEENKEDLPDDHIPVNNFLAVPAIYDGKVVGEIMLANCSTNFTDKHLVAIKRIAVLYALAVHRSHEEVEKAEVENELHQADKMRMIGQLAGGVAHDFNNQLAMILGNAELCLDIEPLAEVTKERLEGIIEVSTRAAVLTKQLLVYARKDIIIRTDINPEEILREVLSVLEKTVDKKISIEQDFGAAELSVKGDPSQIYSALLNIAVNGRDAISGAGKLIFKTRPVYLTNDSLKGGTESDDTTLFIEIEISDSGKGIKPENLERIFEPFFTTKSIGEGAGIGLSAVQGIIKMHDGIIEVDSREEEGTSFRLYLPVASEKSDSKESVSDNKSDTEFSGTVLLVEDDDMIANLNESILKQIGFKVLRVSVGLEAFEIYKKEYMNISLVITDLIMPRMSGEDAITEFIKINPYVKVLIITGSNDGNLTEKLEKMGVAGIIYKPYGYRELYNKIKDLVD